MLLQILFLFSHLLLPSSSHPLPTSTNLTHPDSVARDLVLRTKLAHRWRTLSDKCRTGNPIDDCWLCSSADWLSDRFRLADCSVGFGRGAIGGKNGRLYTVTDPSDSDPSNPVAGTLRHAVIQDEPLWIVFAADMSVRLNEELLVNSFKTLDGRGADVHIAGGPCITIRHVSNVIIHSLHVHDCIPAGNARVRSSPSVDNFHGRSDGDGISVYGSRDVWVDHCTLSSCTDGLIDVTEGSTRVTISNNHFSHHDKVMLLGHSDDFAGDAGMQVTVAFNRFGEKLVQRMPRCRHGYFHVVNNDYTGWGMYAVGGSAGPTINSQGNRYAAPADKDSKEVTKRIDVEKEDWSSWNWRSEGDLMLNGAFFVASGEGSSQTYQMAASTDPLSAELVDQLTGNAGVLALSRGNGEQNRPGNVGGGDNRGFTGGDGWVFTGGGGGAGDVGGYSAAPPPPSFGFEILLPLFFFLFQQTS